MLVHARRGLAVAAALLALSGYSASVDAVTVTFKNACSYKIDLYSRLGGAKTADLSTSIAPGASDSKQFGKDYEGHFRHGQDDAATLIEFSTKGSMAIVWYDISIIPPRLNKGSELCKSLDDCKANSQSKKGFNVPVQMTPLANTNGNQCREVTCLADGCPDAYLFPQDDTKTHACNLETDFVVTFCPSGSAAGSVTTAPATSAPTTGAPQTTAPTTPAPINFKPATPGPTTSTPSTPAPITPKPVTPGPITPKPLTPGPATSNPMTPAPTTASPMTPAPTTAKPTTVSPVTSTPTTPAPVSLTPGPTPVMTPAPVPSVTPTPSLAQTSAPTQAPKTEAPANGKIRVPDVDTIVVLTPPPVQQQNTTPTSAPAKAPAASPPASPPKTASAGVPTPAPTSVNSKKKIKFCE